MHRPHPIRRFLLWPFVLSPLGWAACVGWGLALGRFETPLPLALSLGPVLGALAVWQDRLIILRSSANFSGLALQERVRAIRDLATVFAMVTVTACILLGVAYAIAQHLP